MSPISNRQTLLLQPSSTYLTMGNHRRGPWVQEEDNNLLMLVRSQGPNNWVRISQHMHFRSPKQCRERYHQNLKPTLNHDPITPEEGVLIERMVREMGKRWAEIARRLGHRSDNAVKNWWNGSMNRRRRLHIQHNDNSSRPRYTGPQAPLPFSRPAPVASLNIPATQRQHIDAPMISPSVSEASSQDSLVEPAPSLVADTGSNTTSPNAHSPSFSFNLPPPCDHQKMEQRRPSLPNLHISSPFYPYDEAQALSSISAAQEMKTPANGLGVRPELVHEPMRYIKHQSSQSETQLSLPPLHSVVQENEPSPHWQRPQQQASPLQHPMVQTPVMHQYSPRLEQHLAHSPSRDNRMDLSSLMC